MVKRCRVKAGPRKGRFKKCPKRKYVRKRRNPKRCEYKMSIKKPTSVFKVAAKMYRRDGRPAGKWKSYIRKAWKCYHERK